MPGERENYDRFLLDNALRHGGTSLPELPWERGIFKEIFGGPMDVLPGILGPAPYPVPPVETDEEKTDEKGMPSNFHLHGNVPGLPLFAKHVKALCDRDFSAAQDLAWRKALTSWLTIFADCNFNGSFGKYILEKMVAGDHESFIRWCEERGLGGAGEKAHAHWEEFGNFLSTCWAARFSWKGSWARWSWAK